MAAQVPPPWHTCEPVLAEAFNLLGPQGASGLAQTIRRGSLAISFHFDREKDFVLDLMEKYASVPMSLADACLVRMTELHADPIVFTTDSDFHLYRRHGRMVVPCSLP